MCYREGKAGCVNIVTCGFIYIMTGLYKGTSLLAFGEGRTVLFSCLLLGFSEILSHTAWATFKLIV